MEQREKLKVGQKLWLVASSHYRNDKRNPVEVTVSKIGNKYFELEEYSHCKFEIKTLKKVTETNYVDVCYFSLQEILDLREVELLIGKIRNVFGGYIYPKLTLDQLRKIQDIINS